MLFTDNITARSEMCECLIFAVSRKKFLPLIFFCLLLSDLNLFGTSGSLQGYGMYYWGGGDRGPEKLDVLGRIQASYQSASEQQGSCFAPHRPAVVINFREGGGPPHTRRAAFISSGLRRWMGFGDALSTSHQPHLPTRGGSRGGGG